MNIYLKFIGIIIIFSHLLFLNGCKKNELDPSYKGFARITIGVTPMEFSFATLADDITESQITMIAQVMGKVSGNPRVLQLAVDEELTTAFADEYTVPSTILIPAGAISVSIPVSIKRTKRLLDESTQLVIRIIENSDFKHGPTFTAASVYMSPTCKIVWHDQLTKPISWNNVQWIWGNWSRVKHQLIYQLTGIKDFTDISYVMQYVVESEGNAFLAKYNAENPNNPYKNEFNQEIGFCATCN